MTEQKPKNQKSLCGAKSLIVKPIAAASANRIVRRYHYSGKVVNNSQIHLGVFLNGRCEGVMQFGPSFDKRKLQGLVEGTKWNGFIELNRMAFSDRLPRNSESRALGVALRLIKKTYPHIEWIVSFADGTQCGDGTIYRASGFMLTAIRRNRTIIRLADGSVASAMTYTKGRHIIQNRGGAVIPDGAERLAGFQMRYVYFLNPKAKERLTVEPVPFSKIAEMGAAMYKGEARGKHNGDAAGFHPAESGSIPTPTLQKSEKQDRNKPPVRPAERQGKGTENKRKLKQEKIPSIKDR